MNGEEKDQLFKLTEEVGKLIGTVQSTGDTTRGQISELFHRILALETKFWKLTLILVLIISAVFGVKEALSLL